MLDGCCLLSTAGCEVEEVSPSVIDFEQPGEVCGVGVNNGESVSVDPPSPKGEVNDSARSIPQPEAKACEALILDFELPGGTVISVDFTNARPGFSLSAIKRGKTIKIKVVKVVEGGYAEELGVQSGWMLVGINKWLVEGVHPDVVFDELRNAVKASSVKKRMGKNAPPRHLHLLT